MERRAAITGLVVSLAVTAVLGLAAGLIWGQVAPRAQLQEVSAGVAQVVNAETRAFIGADGWFCLIAAAGGVLTGTCGYLIGIRRRGNVTQAAVTAGLILGSVAAGFVMRWLGEQSGYQAYAAPARARGGGGHLQLLARPRGQERARLLAAVHLPGDRVGRGRPPPPGPGPGT